MQDSKNLIARLLQDIQSGIESKKTIEKINGQVTIDDAELIEIIKEAHLGANGGIEEKNIINIKVFACGCKVQDRTNWGGIDYKGNICCIKHFYRCVRCRRPLSTLTVKPVNGFCYCARCARIVQLKKFLGLKK